MMNTIQSFLALRHDALVSKKNDEVRKELVLVYDTRAGEVAERLTRGNVSIQNGDYETAADVDVVFGPAPWRDND